MTDTAQRIKEAAARLLAGHPVHSDGALTATALAAEARVNRQDLACDEDRCRILNAARVDNA